LIIVVTVRPKCLIFDKCLWNPWPDSIWTTEIQIT
jgi:hypothetical protein